MVVVSEAAVSTPDAAPSTPQGATAASTASPASAPGPATSTPPPVTYTVVSGDSLWAIGQRYDVSMYALAAANHMQLSDVLLVGRLLTLPPGTTAVSANPTTPSAAPAAPAGSPGSYHISSSTTAPVTYSAPSSSLEQCIISRESRGEPQVRNGAYWGLFQFSRSTWIAYGGNPGDYGSASAGEQEQVFNNAIARGGASNWTPYDGC